MVQTIKQSSFPSTPNAKNGNMKAGYLKFAAAIGIICSLATAVNAKCNPRNKPFKSRVELKRAIDTCFYGDDPATAATLVEYNRHACETQIKPRYGWPMNEWCTGLVDDMQLLFVGKRDFNEDISDWDTSRVTNLYETFSFAESFTGDISRWDVSKVWKMFGLFNGEVLQVFVCMLNKISDSF